MVNLSFSNLHPDNDVTDVGIRPAGITNLTGVPNLLTSSTQLTVKHYEYSTNL